MLGGHNGHRVRVALIRGEAGIGKTTLVRALVERHNDRVHTLTGTCDDLLTPQPLGPIWNMAIEEPALDQSLRKGDSREVFATLLDLFVRDRVIGVLMTGA